MLKPTLERRGALQRLAAAPLWLQVTLGVPAGLLAYRAIIWLVEAMGRVFYELGMFDNYQYELLTTRGEVVIVSCIAVCALALAVILIRRRRAP
jgi:hypothetical protein